MRSVHALFIVTTTVLTCIHALPFKEIDYPSSYMEETPNAFDKGDFNLNPGTQIFIAANGSQISLMRSDVIIDVYSGSGLISITKVNGTSFNFTVLSVRELDVNHFDVDGTFNHSIVLNDTTSFTLDSLFSALIDGVNVTAMNMSAPLLEEATLVLTVFVIEGEGSFTTGSDTLFVSPGSVRIEVEVLNWPFCHSDTSSCNGQVGASLEVTLAAITANGTSGRVSAAGVAFGTDNSTLYVDNQLLVDGDVAVLGSRYPLFIPGTQDNITDIVVGIPKFEQSGLFDFIFILNDQNSPSTVVQQVNANQTQLRIDEGTGVLDFAFKNSNNSVQVLVSSIQELGIAGQQVGVTGLGAIAQHNRSSLSTELYRVSSTYNTEIGNATAKAVNVTASLLGNSTIRIISYLFESPQNLTIGNDTQVVNSNTLKFSLEIKNWPFCEAQGQGFSQCNADEIGHSLEVELQAIGKLGDELRASSDNNNVYSLGDSAEFIFSRNIVVDGFEVQMEDGFPHVQVRNGNSFIVFRFPTFAHSLFYDPLLSLKNESSGASSIFSGLSVLLAAAACLMGLLF